MSTPEDVGYPQAVGERLRSIRMRRGLSLQGVEALSAQEFKASALGAYERGERSISVPRLQRLALLYDVAVDELLPVPDASGSAGDPRPGADEEEVRSRLATIAERDPALLERYVRMIRARRRHPGGATIEIRAEDVRAMELLLGAPRPAEQD